MTNIGLRPTFDDGPPSVETLILDFDQDVYGRELKIELIEMLRGEVKFSNIDALKEQINRDILDARAMLHREGD